MRTLAQVIPFPTSPTSRVKAMTDSQRARHRIQDFLAMSEQILALAEACDWSSALALQEERRQALETWFVERGDSVARDELVDVINQLLALDARITERLQVQRQHLLVDASQARQGHRAIQAYLGS